MDVQGVSGSAPAFDGKSDCGVTKPSLARELENANGAPLAVSFAGKAAKGMARASRDRSETGVNKYGREKKRHE